VNDGRGPTLANEVAQRGVAADLVDQLNAEHAAAEAGLRSGMIHAIRAGLLLQRVRAELGHGEWGPWLAVHFHGSARLARMYVQAATAYPELADADPESGNALPFSSLRGALAALAPPARAVQYLPHDALNLLPMMSDDELDELAADIRANGLMRPIALNAEGTLLDGRCRLEACRRARVQPTFQTISVDDETAYILSTNVHRQHLTRGQRAMLIAEAEAWRQSA
jgi:hypothetical protein